GSHASSLFFVRVVFAYVRRGAFGLAGALFFGASCFEALCFGALFLAVVPLAFVFCAAAFFFGSALFFAPSFSALRFLFAWRWERIASICAIVDLELMMTGMTIALRWVLL